MALPPPAALAWQNMHVPYLPHCTLTQRAIVDRVPDLSREEHGHGVRRVSWGAPDRLDHQTGSPHSRSGGSWTADWLCVRRNPPSITRCVTLRAILSGSDRKVTASELDPASARSLPS
jgi:hypothetical protein